MGNNQGNLNLHGGGGGGGGGWFHCKELIAKKDQ